MQSVHACAVQTHFSVFVFFSKRVPLASHFGAFWRPWAHFWLQGGAPGLFWRGLKKRRKKEVLRNHTGAMSKGEGGPHRDSSKERL